jgi:ribosomal protein S2
LKDSLSSLFGPVRAEIIAITEVTRAAVEGERAMVAEVAKQGIQMVAVWNTNNDEIVCPICAPLNQKKQGEAWTFPPPAHPRCRCWLNHDFVH